MIRQELDAKIDLLRFERHDPRVIVMSLCTLRILLASLEGDVDRFVGEGTVGLTKYGSGKWHWYRRGSAGYSAIQCATYKGIPLLHYYGDLETSACSDLVKLPDTVVV